MGDIIRVAQVTLSMGIGGIENLIVNLIKKIDKNKFKVDVVCLDSGGVLLEKLVADGVNTWVFKRKPGLDFSLILQLATFFRRNKYHIIHTHNEAAHFYGGIAATLMKRPVLVNTEHSRHYIDKCFRRRVEKFFLSFVTSKYVVVSNELSEHSRRRDGISRRKIEVISNGIDVEYYNKTKSTMTKKKIWQLRERLGIPKKSIVIIMLGRLHPIKNHELLFEAILLLKKDVTNDVHVIVVGDGDLMPELKKRCIDLGIADCIHFLGGRTDVAELLSISDVYVLCSKSEGLPLALLEAMACRTPVIVTSGANRSRIVEDGKNGIVVKESPLELMIGLKRLLLERRVARGLAEAAYKQVKETYSLEKMVARYSRLYMNLVS